jgi:hypothetical protein
LFTDSCRAAQFGLYNTQIVAWDEAKTSTASGLSDDPEVHFGVDTLADELERDQRRYEVCLAHVVISSRLVALDDGGIDDIANGKAPDDVPYLGLQVHDAERCRFRRDEKSLRRSAEADGSIEDGKSYRRLS